MHQGFTLTLPYMYKAAQSFKGAGVGIVTMVGVNKFSGVGSFIGETTASLISSLGKGGTLGTVMGGGYVAAPLFNQKIGSLGIAVGEGIDQNTIGVGGISPNAVIYRVWTKDSVLTDGITLLLWDADPNTVVNGNTAGETKLYTTAIHSHYGQSDGKEWRKIVMPNTWVEISSAAANVEALEERTEIEVAFKVAYSTAYKELTYTAGVLTSVDIWTTAGKTLKLFTKTLEYTGANLTTITLVDEVNNNTLTKVLAYTDNVLDSVTIAMT